MQSLNDGNNAMNVQPAVPFGFLILMLFREILVIVTVGMVAVGKDNNSVQL
jgi:hypothetical protein